MTIIAEQPTPEPSARHKQQLAAATLAHLLTHPLPQIATWRIDTDREALLFGQLHATGFDTIRVHLHQWAAVLANPTWQINRYKAGGGHLSVRGLFLGVTVEVWDGISEEQCAIDPKVLAELDEPVEAVSV